jgi:hypothetical protein
MAEAPHLVEPPWARRIRKSVFAFIFFTAGLLLGKAFDLADGAGKLYDRFFKEPEAFVLADRTAKSVFSDQLALRAWRRLFWARNFNARVETGAPLGDVDHSWNEYINSDADWNANLMISIVGLERHYDQTRAQYLEGPVQDKFRYLDQILGTLRRSSYIKALRDGRMPSDQDITGAKATTAQVEIAIRVVNAQLYQLVRCIAPQKKDAPAQPDENVCQNLSGV